MYAYTKMLLKTTGKSNKATPKQEFVIKKLLPYTASYTPVFLSGDCKNSLRLIHRCDLYSGFYGIPDYSPFHFANLYQIWCESEL